MSLPTTAGERRPVTALFADVVGSTSLAETMDAEEWSELIGGAVRRMSAVVDRYEGHVDQVLGDGILAFFGLRPAHEDDPQRAVRAAFEMVQEMRRYSAETTGPEGTPLRIRVGVNTGPVVVREVTDSAGNRKPTALGDPVNVAARIHAEALPDTVLITAETYGFVAAGVEARSIGRLELKGKSEPVEAYEVLRVTGSLTRPRGVAGLGSTMVGRDAERDRLIRLLEDVAASGGRAALITGEPGIGKTRLLREVRTATTATGARWYEARCVSNGLTLPYHLVAAVVRALAGMPEGEAGEPGDGEAHGSISRLDPYLAHLLSLPAPAGITEELRRLDPAGLLARYVAAVRSLVQASAADGPCVVVCEDVHWADPASVELLVRVLPELRTLPVLLLLATRTDSSTPGWRLVSEARELYGERLEDVQLAPLSGDQARDLVGNLLEIESLSGETRDYILASSDGNPLFIEEVIRMLIDRGAIERRGDRWVATRAVSRAEIPDSLHGLLLARIDRLPADAGAVLRTASVIGRRFSVHLLRQVVGADAALASHLAELEGSGMIEVAATEPELEYLFRHVLIQEAAYESLLRQERRHVHRLVAAILEEQHPVRLDELAPVLAMHLERAGEVDRAVTYLERAGRHAVARFAPHEARDAFLRARALLDDGRDDPEIRRRRARLELEADKAGFTFIPAEENLAVLAHVRDEARATDDEELLAEALLQTAAVRTGRGEAFTSARLRESLDEALEISARRQDAVLRAHVLATRATARFQGAEYRAAVADFEAAIPVLEEVGELAAASVHAGTLAIALARLGAFDHAIRWIERATEAGTVSGNPDAILDADIAHAIIEALRGDPVAAIEFATRAATRADEVDNKACGIVARSVIGEQSILLGRHDEAILMLEEGAELSEFCDLLPTRIELTKALLESTRARMAGVPPMTRRIDRAIRLARALKDRNGEAEAYRQRARDRLAAGRSIDDVLADYATAERLFRDLEARPELARTLAEHARVLREAGREADADALAAEEHALRVEMGLATAAADSSDRQRESTSVV